MSRAAAPAPEPRVLGDLRPLQEELARLRAARYRACEAFAARMLRPGSVSAHDAGAFAAQLGVFDGQIATLADVLGEVAS